MKFLKYKYAAFFSAHLGGAIPLPPFEVRDHPTDLLGSTAGRFVRRMMRSDVAREFAVGILYSKKAAPRADEADLESARISTKEVLTTDHPVHISLTPYRGRTVQLSDIKEQIHRTCVEICRPLPGEKPWVIDDQVLHHPYAPSIRANYVDTRARLGTFGTLQSLGLLAEPDYDDSLLKTTWSKRIIGPLTEDDSIVDPSRGILEYRDAVLRLSEQVTEASGVELRESQDETQPLVINPVWKDAFKRHYRDLYEEVRKKAVGEKFDVKLVALAESLKIRVISKGPPLHYFLLKPVQKFLSRLLGRFQCFRLTRETVTSDYLSDFFEKHEGVFSSLDYSSATDLINPECSEQAVRTLASSLQMPQDIESAFLAALTGHTIEGVAQKWGQLMGSIVSFVILCIVNVSVIRFSFELTVKQRVGLRRLPATVNGDDGLVRAPREFLSIWEDVAAVAGLIPSIGKVYVNETYANINSTSFELVNGRFKLIPYVNMGLVYGFQRSSVSESGTLAADIWDSRIPSIGARHRTLIDSCPEHLRASVHRSFLKHNDSVLSHLHHLPFFIPEEFGGVGLRPILDLSTLSGDVDLIRYSFGPLDWELQAVEWLKTKGSSRMLQRLPTDAPIQVRSTWTRLIPYRNRGALSQHQYDMTEEDIGLLDVSSYYVVPTLVASQISKPGLPALRNNQKVWRLLRRKFARDSGPSSFFVAPLSGVPSPALIRVSPHGVQTRGLHGRTMVQDSLD